MELRLPGLGEGECRLKSLIRVEAMHLIENFSRIDGFGHRKSEAAFSTRLWAAQR